MREENKEMKEKLKDIESQHAELFQDDSATLKKRIKAMHSELKDRHIHKLEQKLEQAQGEVKELKEKNTDLERRGVQMVSGRNNA